MTEGPALKQYLSRPFGGVEIVGDLPVRPGRPRLLLMFANTRTERRILEHYLDETQARESPENPTQVAWFSEHKAGDHLRHDGLVEALQASQTLDIVPIGIAWKPKSQDHQSWLAIQGWMRLVDKNGRQRRTVRRTPQRTAVIVGEFGTQKALQAKYDRMAAKSLAPARTDLQSLANFIALEAAVTIERDSRSTTGATIKYPRHVIRSIWGRPLFQAQLQEIATESGRSLEDVQNEARTCLKDLVPNVRAPHVSLSTAFARKVCSLGYDKELVYDTAKLESIRELALTRPTALVWTHKTHIDGFAMMLATRERKFPLIHLIGGDNMAFFGIGYLMSRAGAVFIRRKIDSEVYKAVLRYYLSWLLEKRFPVSWALEGTRSRNGKLMPPRFGILKYVVEAAAKENMKNLTIVPISIYYDLIAELGDYAREQTGAAKRKESIAWFADYLRSLRKPLGRISFGIGDPVTVDATQDTFTQAINGDTEQFSIELQKLAFDASVKANDVTPLTPSALISLILTGAAPQALTVNETSNEIAELIEWAKARDLPMTDELADVDRTRINHFAEAMEEIGVVSRYDGGHEAVFSIAEGKHFEASYYRNNAIHLFVDKALIELALFRLSELSPGADVDRFWSEVKHVRDIFKFEFFYPEWPDHQDAIEKELDRALPDWKARLAAGQAHDLLIDLSPLVSHAVLRPFAEAYSLVSDIISRNEGSAALDPKAIAEDALKLGKQAYLQRQISSEESIGKLMFSNGVQLAENRGLVPGGGEDLYAARMAFFNELHELTKQLRTLREIADDRRRRSPQVSGKGRLKVVSTN